MLTPQGLFTVEGSQIFHIVEGKSEEVYAATHLEDSSNIRFQDFLTVDPSEDCRMASGSAGRDRVRGIGFFSWTIHYHAHSGQ